MKSEVEIVQAIKNGDTRRKDFFLNRLKVELRRYGVCLEDDLLERLFQNAMDNYLQESTEKQSIGFYYYTFHFIRNAVEKDREEEFVSNSFFLKQDMVILKEYLTEYNGQFLSEEEISDKLGISITSVVQTVHTLRRYVRTNLYDMKKIFGDVDLILEKRYGKGRKLQTKQVSCTEQDFQLIGLYTGQIGDVCLDVEEIAQKLGYNKFVVESELKKVYKLLENVHNFNALLKRYPDILEMLVIRGKTLNISFQNPIEKPKERKKYGIDLATREKWIIQMLQLLYQKQENGKYLNLKEIAEKMEIHYQSFVQKKNKVLLQLEEDSELKKKILEFYPKYLQDKKDYETYFEAFGKPVKVGSKIAVGEKRIVQMLQLLYRKQENGKYLRFKEIAKKMGMHYNSFLQKKKKVLLQLEEDSEFKKRILELYPEFLQDKEQYENLNLSRRVGNKTLVTEETIQLLQLLYQKQEDGTYLDFKEIAAKMKISYGNFINRKNRVFSKLEEDSEFRERVLELYPEFLQDKKEREMYLETLKIPKQVNNKITAREEKMVQMLQLLYQRQEDGKYLGFKEIAERMGMHYNSFIQKKNNVLLQLEENPEFKKRILEFYPDLPMDIQTFENERSQENSEEIEVHLTEKESTIVDMLYSNTTKKVEFASTLAQNLSISPSCFSILKSSVISKIQRSPYLLKQYPHIQTEIAIREGFRKMNSVALTEEELENLKKNARYYDIPNVSLPQQDKRRKFLKAIQNLEASEFQFYVASCTMEQKAILALRFGYFNETIFSSKDVAELFHIDEAEVILLTETCLASTTKDFVLQKNFS